jgi:hypothetical protein
MHVVLSQTILGNNATIKEAVEKGTRKGACIREQGKVVRGSIKSKEKKKDVDQLRTQEVRMWKNLIHLGLGFWSLM